jgi:hypothetical protein
MQSQRAPQEGKRQARKLPLLSVLNGGAKLTQRSLYYFT